MFVRVCSMHVLNMVYTRIIGSVPNILCKDVQSIAIINILFLAIKEYVYLCAAAARISQDISFRRSSPRASHVLSRSEYLAV
jgi:hypothetical protein